MSHRHLLPQPSSVTWPSQFFLLCAGDRRQGNQHPQHCSLTSLAWVNADHYTPKDVGDRDALGQTRSPTLPPFSVRPSPIRGPDGHTGIPPRGTGIHSINRSFREGTVTACPLRIHAAH